MDGRVVVAIVVAVIGAGGTVALVRAMGRHGGRPSVTQLGIALAAPGRERVRRASAQGAWRVGLLMTACACLVVLSDSLFSPALFAVALVLAGSAPVVLGRRHAPTGPRVALAVTPRLRDAVHPVVLGAPARAGRSVAVAVATAGAGPAASSPGTAGAAR